jgi:hypothetical protein
MKDSIINFDDLIPDELKIHAKNIHKHMPQHPALCVLAAGSGRGKTNLLLNILIKGMIFDKVYIFIRDDSEDSYKYLKSLYKKMIKEMDKTLNKKHKLEDYFILTNNLDKIPKLDDLDKNIQNAVIFDDLISADASVQNKIKILFEAGRKRSASLFYLTQSYFAVPKGVRLNSNFCAVWSVNRRETRLLADTYATELDYEDFHHILNTITRKGRHDFLSINDKQPRLVDKLRWNLFKRIPREIRTEAFESDSESSDFE